MDGFMLCQYHFAQAIHVQFCRNVFAGCFVITVSW